MLRQRDALHRDSDGDGCSYRRLGYEASTLNVKVGSDEGEPARISEGSMGVCLANSSIAFGLRSAGCG